MAVIAIEGISKRFGSKQALKDVTLNVEAGEIFGFLGPNGAGKSTTIRCIMDYLHADEGSIHLLDEDNRHQGVAIRRQVGYLSSDMQLYEGWTGREHLRLVEGVRGKSPQAEKIAQELGLDLSRRVKTLSSGNKQKLAIVLAFAGEPKLLIMDEPTRGLDPLLQTQLYELLRQFAKGGGTVFLSSHNLPEVQQICTQVAVIREGQIVAEKSMADIRELRIHVVQATVAKAMEPGALKLQGVEVIQQTEKTVHLKIKGEVNDLLKVLLRHGIVDLEITHASLEDVFMEFYR